MRIDVSPCTIGKFFYGPNYHPPINKEEMYYHLEDMPKITQKQMRSEKKIGHFWSIVERIAMNGENLVWVIKCSGVVLQKIEKDTLNF